MLEDVRQLPVEIEDRISPALMREAGRIKASYRVSSADRHEFGPVESAGEVSVQWVR